MNTASASVFSASRLAFVLACALSLGLVACSPGDSSASNEAVVPAAESGLRVAKLDISGMTCHGCASGVEETLKKLPGVQTAVVSQEDKTARVTLSSDAQIGETELRAAVDERGYKVTECTWES